MITQLCAYIIVTAALLLFKVESFRSSRGKEKAVVEKYTWFEFLFMGFRTLVSSSIAGFAILCGAEAVLHFENLPVLAMLPVSFLH
jgi:hypothetical protein